MEVVRNQILDALQKSITKFTAEADLDSTRRQDANTTSRVNWVVESGRKALRDLTIFFAGPDSLNVRFYSGEPVANYIWISCLFKDADSVNTSCSQMKSLEAFWLAKDIILWDSRPDNIFCMFAKSDCISPRAEGLKNARRILTRELPPPDEICQSAIIALLFLLKTYLPLTASDLYYLMVENLGHKELCHRPQILCGLSEEDLCLDTDLDALWHSITSAAVLPATFSRSSTKVLTFPSKLPKYQTTYNYMDIYQPHGSQPTAKSTCAIWGAWKDQGSWRSIASFSNCQVAELYRKCLQRTNTSPPQLPSLLSSHWTNLLRCIYKLGINDSRLILRNVAKDIEEIRYNNSAKPSIGSANVCLMYLNHFDYFTRITKALCEEVENYPPQWRSVGPVEIAPLNWIQGVSQECEILHKEVLVVAREAKEVRKLILEQHTLLESRKTKLLTILASIFVPITFVASFFGMNTQEINGSAWQLKYYFIAAIPFAVLTIVLPLIILPVFSFIWRHLATHSKLRYLLYWGLVITTLVLNLSLGIMNITNSTPLSYNATLAICWILEFYWGAVLFSGIISRFQKFCRLNPELRSALLLPFRPTLLLPFLREEWWQMLFLVLAIGSFTLGNLTYTFVELPLYFIYFFSVWYRKRKEKKSKGKEL